MRDYYVTLTGSKNNAGDFLIRKCGLALLGAQRPDRDVVDLDGWKPFDAAQLATINGARALILLGGPALQPKMYPGVYPLCTDLGAIRVPVVALGIGWSGVEGSWAESLRYPFTPASRRLLARIDADGLGIGVRDLYSVSALRAAGQRHVTVTGCPAFFGEQVFGPRPAVDNGRVVFSVGVTMTRSRAMFRQNQELASLLQRQLPQGSLQVAFHHSLDARYLSTHRASARFHAVQLRFAEWCRANGMEVVDVSGSAERMIETYAAARAHIGYRVHAHILTSGIGLPSVLLAEDGRGIAINQLLGGVGAFAFRSVSHSLAVAALHRLHLPFDAYRATPGAAQGAFELLAHELDTGTSRRLRLAAIAELEQNFREFTGRLP